jgi:hypothetical protein
MNVHCSTFLCGQYEAIFISHIVSVYFDLPLSYLMSLMCALYWASDLSAYPTEVLCSICISAYSLTAVKITFAFYSLVFYYYDTFDFVSGVHTSWVLG